MVSLNGKGGPQRQVTGKALFRLGMGVCTPAAAEVMERHGVSPIILSAMHASGIWGDVPPEDAAANEDALKTGARIMSVYKFGDDTLWIITEADRSATTILTPSDY
ncbi:MAG: hypothetical protein AMXMBFR58_29410 [Phycisphaerae bacterium]